MSKASSFKHERHYITDETRL